MMFENWIVFLIVGLSVFYVLRYVFRILTRGELPNGCANCALNPSVGKQKKR